MNNKRIIKTISAIALLLSLSLTACGTQDTQLLTATEESMQETATQETEANTETTTDTESPWRRGMPWSGSSVWTTVLRDRRSWQRSRWI